MGQLRVGHSVYRIEGQYLAPPFFCAKMKFCRLLDSYPAKWSSAEKISEKYHGPVSSCTVSSDIANLTALLGVIRPLRLKYELPNLR